MYHSVIIDTSKADAFNLLKSINTYNDWFLIPDGRPTISNPPLQSSYIDVPGSSGSIDATEWLTGFPLYGDREGDLVFYVENDHGPWTTRRNAINMAIHGRKVKLMLEDEREYYYIGRLSVSDWSSEKDWSKLTIKYRFEPFKYSTNSTTKWLWDPFNFENGRVYDSTYSNINETSTVKYFEPAVLPVIPSYAKVVVKARPNTSSAGGVQIRFVNSELNIDTVVTAPRGTTVYPELLFSNLSGTNLVSASVTGNDLVSFDVQFRSI